MLCPCSTTRLRLPIKGFWGSDSESVWIYCGLYKYQTCLIFFTTVMDPLSPLPTNSPVSGFLTPQTQIYTILCCLRHSAILKPRTLSPERPGFSLRPQQKSPSAVLGNLLLVPGGLRKPHTSLGPSQYIPDRIGVETNHNRDNLGLIPDLGQDSIFPTIFHGFFHRLSRVKGPRRNRGLILWWNRGIRST